MSETGQMFDAVSVASGGEVTSSKFAKSSSDGMTLQLVGDSNSTNIDIIVMSKANSAVPVYSPYVTSMRGIDLTQYENNSKMFPIDVNEVAEFKIMVVNKAGSSTSIDGYYRFN